MIHQEKENNQKRLKKKSMFVLFHLESMRLSFGLDKVASGITVAQKIRTGLQFPSNIVLVNYIIFCQKEDSGTSGINFPK